MNPFFADILGQPTALRKAISLFPHIDIEQIKQKMNTGNFDRIIMTGMGASYNAAYPAFIQLTNQAIPVSLVNSAELLHFLGGTLGGKTLLWLNSQSGRSVELINILGLIETKSVGCALSFVNDSSSPLARNTDFSIAIQAGKEAVVSTKSYTNMLAANLLASIQLVGGDVKAAIRDLQTVADKMEAYLTHWDANLKQIEDHLCNEKPIFILGRGSSMGAAWNGSLMCMEVGKFPAEGMIAADFRHGPFELVSKDINIIFIEGPPQTAEINRSFAEEIAGLGANVTWISTSLHHDLPTLLIPQVHALFLPIVEILPMQLLSIFLAERQSIVPGSFRLIGKVTSKE